MKFKKVKRIMRKVKHKKILQKEEKVQKKKIPQRNQNLESHLKEEKIMNVVIEIEYQ